MATIGPRFCTSALSRIRQLPSHQHQHLGLTISTHNFRPSLISTPIPARSLVRLFSSVTRKCQSPAAKTITKFRLTLIRNIFTPATNTKFDSVNTILKFRSRDGVPKHYELIYRSDFANYMISIQVLQSLALGAILTMMGIKTLEIYFPPTEEEILAQVEKAKLAQFIPENETEENMLARLRNPKFEELAEGGLPVLGFLIASCVLGIGMLVRLQRTLPIRIYTSEKGHSIAVLYGHIRPFRTTTYEFMAGNLKLKSNPTKRFFLMANYKDINGKTLVLMEHFFRYPSDLQRLCGTYRDSGDWEKDHPADTTAADYPKIPDDPSLNRSRSQAKYK